MKITTAKFIKSGRVPADYPPADWPEIAFAGRSNVGKSSLINTLTRRKKLARVSCTPGQTRTLNFFLINDRVMFTDLPGYGYAKVSGSERESWREMVNTYLENRANLRAMVVIIDIRRGPEEEEAGLIAWLLARKIAPLVVATKADKIGRNQRVKPIRAAAAFLGIPPGEIIPFSSLSGEGCDQVWDRIRKLCEEPPPPVPA